MKKISYLIICMMVMICLSGCFKPKEKTFQTNDISITLDESFKEQKQIGINLALVSNKYVTSIVLDSASSFYTLDEYCNRVKDIMGLDLTFNDSVTNSNVKFKYTLYNNKGSNEVEYSYMSSIFKFNNIFYIVDMAVEKEDYDDKVKEQFMKWTKTITFKIEENKN